MIVPREKPFDAVLVISFGGPESPDDIRPFLQNVLRGRRIPPERVEEVAHHYEMFGGVSPLTEFTYQQARGLRQSLRGSGIDLPVYVGMRNWHPFLTDALTEMADAGVRRAVGFILAAHQGYSSCGQYKQNLIEARKHLIDQGRPDIDITYVDGWHTHPGFIAANVEHANAAIEQLTPSVRSDARLIFTAHSIPRTMADPCAYEAQLLESARLVAERLGRMDWALVYQSRSGRPGDPWLEPDICGYLKAEHAKGLRAAVILPIGFVCDHVEVLYDLDHEAADVCRELGLPMARAESVNADPLFTGMMADLVRETLDRYRTSPPLPIISAQPTPNPEGSPPAASPNPTRSAKV
jgi:ferrochelatase